MSDIINLLPDSVANQIAAGEVIQRPASVVKELIENATDAEADQITVNIKDAGRTLVQVIDNGMGMSETDARMAFERHATSKIRLAEDLFAINSMGFRGEALASIAAVADVELKTKQVDQDLGTYIHIKGSELQKQETVSTPTGCNFSVKNLFFNIPARRKFLKKDATEFKHIILEFKKTALSHPEINLTLIHNDLVVYKLEAGSIRKRIIDIFGKHTDKLIIPVDSETSILKISGFVGKPESAKKRNEEQFFFVNKRYMKHPYFYKAILTAFEQIIKPDLHPSFFLYFDIEPNRIDINIHPAKIQINFDDSQGIFQLIRASVRKALGTFNIVPSIDFDRDGYIEMPYSGDKTSKFIEPEINSNSGFNPFDEEKNSSKFSKSFIKKEKVPDNWDALYSGFESGTKQESTTNTQTSFNSDSVAFSKLFQFKNKYIVTPVKSGLMMIHITRAHERVLFESLTHSIRSEIVHTQKTLYPTVIELSSEDYAYFKLAMNAIQEIGFEIDASSEGKLKVLGIPAYLDTVNVKDLVEAVLIQIKDDNTFLKERALENISEVIAKKASLSFAKTLAAEEMQYLIDQLFSCQMPNFTNDGRKIIEIIKIDDLEKKFK